MQNLQIDRTVKTGAAPEPIRVSPAQPGHGGPGAISIATAVAALDAWLDSMRGPSGYGGPVVHWWRQSLGYTGPGLDWRYEGIIAGYLHLWERTRDARWLEKACRAGDDLVGGQLPDGHFAASAFEWNPASGGTPHEAACDAALLHLALVLRETRPADAERYRTCAARNLQAVYVAQLWDAEQQAFADAPGTYTFVPNKAATACEAMFLLAELTGEERWVACYALPTLERILEHQVRDVSPLAGAIAQNSQGARRVEKYFPLYIARCVPALLCGYQWTRHARYADGAVHAMQFVARWAGADGSLPTAIYANQRANRFPSWIAALGDVLRAAQALRPYGFDAGLEALQVRLLAGQDTSGGIRTASGFAAQSGGRRPARPDVRDVLHVSGWCDKAFRYLASQVPPGTVLPAATSEPVEAECALDGRPLHWVETSEKVEVSDRSGARYRWRKGEPWAAVAGPEFWLR